MRNKNADYLSDNVFLATLCLLVMLAGGIYFTVAINVSPTLVSQLNPLIMLGVALGGIVLGSLLINVAGKIPVQLVGFIIIPSVFGFISSPWVTNADPNILYEAALLTAMSCAIMFVLSGVFPTFFIKIRGILFGALIALIIVGVLSVFVFNIDMTVYHLAAVVIFLGFLGYDLVMARRTERTLSNAIILSSRLFIDLINLLIHFYALLDD